MDLSYAASTLPQTAAIRTVVVVSNLFISFLLYFSDDE